MAAHLALLLAAASLGLSRSTQPQLPSASRVCVKNSGGFVLDFDLWNTADNHLSSWSRSISSSMESCLDLSSLDGVAPGNPVVTVVHAESGASHSLPPLLYAPASDAESTTVNFLCTGSDEDFSCTRTIGAQEETADNQPGELVAVPASEQVRAKRICVHNTGDLKMKIRLWDTQTGALGAWSKGFDIWAEGPDYSRACVDGGDLPGVARGHPLVAVVDPEGATPLLVRSVLYDPDATRYVLVECLGLKKYNCVFEGSWRRLRGASPSSV